MLKPWKRFTTWLYYLRHPCTIITMDEAPAKGVDITFSYSGEYEQKVQKDLNTFKKPLEYSAHFEGKITDHNFLADLFSQEEARKRGKKRLEEVAYALYLADYNATHPSLGRPLETWNELCEDEQQRYLRYVNTVLKEQERMYGATVKKMEKTPKKQMDWPIGDHFVFGKPDTSMMYRFLEEDEDGTEH